MLAKGESYAPCIGSPFVMIYDEMFVYQKFQGAHTHLRRCRRSALVPAA